MTEYEKISKDTTDVADTTDAAKAITTTSVVVIALAASVAYDVADEKGLFKFLKSIIDYISKQCKLFKEAFMYQFNTVFADEYAYYNLLMHLFFIFLLILTFVLLFWDSIYRQALKSSRCKDLSKILNENTDINYPFVYNIIIIHTDNMDYSFDKYAIKIEYDFINKKTIIHYGEDLYYNQVKFSPDQPYKKEEVFNYYDLSLMDNNTEDSIKKNIILFGNYKFIPVSVKNKILKTKTARDLAKFIEEYAENQNKQPYIIDDILNAIEQRKKNIL